jgi:hypothetical protein
MSQVLFPGEMAHLDCELWLSFDREHGPVAVVLDLVNPRLAAAGQPRWQARGGLSPALVQSAFVFAVVTSAANVGAVKATASPRATTAATTLFIYSSFYVTGTHCPYLGRYVSTPIVSGPAQR